MNLVGGCETVGERVVGPKDGDFVGLGVDGAIVGLEVVGEMLGGSEGESVGLLVGEDVGFSWRHPIE